MNLRTTRVMTTAALAVALFSGAAGFAWQAAGTAPAPATSTKKGGAAKPEATPPPSAQEIAQAQSQGLVWVNLNTKVYHKAGTEMYGKTKHGKFMTEADATKAGYRAAKEPVSKKAGAAKAAPSK